MRQRLHRRRPARGRLTRARRQDPSDLTRAQCTEVALDAQWQEKGVRLLPLDLALEEFEIPLYKLFHDAIKDADNRFLAWHYGTWSHGAFLWVPPGLEIAEPFFIDLRSAAKAFQRASRGRGSRGGSARSRGAAHSRRRIRGVPRRRSAEDHRLCNAAVDMQLADASALRFCEMQELGPRSLYFRHARADVGRDGSLRHFDAAFGGRLDQDPHRMLAIRNGRGSVS